MRLAECHPDKKHYAKGKCSSCYNRDSSRAWRKKNPEKKRENDRRWSRENKNKLWKHRHPEKYKVSARRTWIKQYGLTLEDYDALLLEQSGVCAICQEPPSPTRRLAVDHDHKTNAVRGLLCTRCNGWVVPVAEHWEQLFERAQRYLREKK
jgi:hypothetical protein